MGSREALAAEVQPDPVRVAAVTTHLPAAITSTGQTIKAGGLDGEADWVRDTIGAFCWTQRPLEDQTAARLLADMAVPELRDAAWLLMDQPDATKHVALWADLTRRSPAEVRTPAASLLASPPGSTATAPGPGSPWTCSPRATSRTTRSRP